MLPVSLRGDLVGMAWAPLQEDNLATTSKDSGRLQIVNTCPESFLLDARRLVKFPRLNLMSERPSTLVAWSINFSLSTIPHNVIRDHRTYVIALEMRG